MKTYVSVIPYASCDFNLALWKNRAGYIQVEAHSGAFTPYCTDHGNMRKAVRELRRKIGVKKFHRVVRRDYI